MTQEKGLTTVAPIVELSVPIEQVVESWNRYLKLCEAILSDEDYQWAEGRKFRKKSAFRKLARAFNVADQVVDREIERDERERVVEASVYVKAIAPNGREAVGYGSCSIWERAHDEDRTDDDGNITCKGPCDGRKHFSKPDHTIPATAHTRAKNRAIADLIGAGEVSAEEVALDEEGEMPVSKQQAASISIMPFGKHKGKSLSEIPEDYLKWAAEKADRPEVRDSIQAELDRRKNPPIEVQATVVEPEPSMPSEPPPPSDADFAEQAQEAMPQAEVKVLPKEQVELDNEMDAFLKEELGLAATSKRYQKLWTMWTEGERTRERLDKAKKQLREGK